jgi:hypothetical protein
MGLVVRNQWRAAMKAIEMYYSVDAASIMLSVCSKTILRKIKSGELGKDVVNLGSDERPDYRIPASGINGLLDARRIFSDPSPIAARTEGELRRKAA